MQTFLPYPSFARSAAVLDDRRLGKQRVEALQILRALHLEGYGWAHHPAVLMWRGHTRALVAYGLAVVDEWCRRGRADTTAPNIAEFARPHDAVPAEELSPRELPPWLGWDALHRSHRAALRRKDPEHYGAVFADAPPDAAYVWPPAPAPPPPTAPFTAWVVRGTTAAAAEAFRDVGLVGVPATFGADGDTPKRRRQRDRLAATVAVGDRVVVPLDDDLAVGVVDGPPRERTVAGAAHLVRPVAWHGAVSRAGLRRPFQLQDPQLVFALRGEPAVAS